MKKVIAKKNGGKNKKAKKGISLAKKRTVKHNKEVKAGKARVKGANTFIQKQQEDQRIQKAKAEKISATKEDITAAREAAEAARAALEDEARDDLVKEMLERKKRKRKGGEDDDSMDELEDGALNRIAQEEKEAKKVKAMLPIKTKTGWKRVEVVGGEEEEVEEEEGEQEGDQDGEGEEVAEELEDVDGQTAPEEQVSVVELYARRKQLLNEKKILIGTLASNFLENPEERMSNLDNLVKLVDAPQPESIQMSVQRIAAASVVEVLKDVTPGYRIFHQDIEKTDRLKQDTRRLQEYENGILKGYKSFLLKLEVYVNYFKAGKKKQPKDGIVMKQAELFLSYMCELLAAHPYFNFAFNILHAIVPVLNAVQESARLKVKEAIQTVFKGDMKGEISLEACRLINHLVKSRKHYVNSDAVDVLRALRIKDVNLDKEKEMEIEIKKKEANRQKIMDKNHISRLEKKRRKKLEALNNELREAKGEESKQVKEKNFTEATKQVFTIYFRVLKSFPDGVLLGAVLEGLAKFAHVINIQFFSDLVTVFRELLKRDFLPNRESLLLVKTVFTILSGQGEALNIDPASFYTHLYNIIFNIDPVSSQNDLVLALESLDDMIVKRKKRVTKARVLAFSKRLLTLSLQLLHNGTVGSLGQLRDIVNAHKVTHQLLDSQYEVGSGVFDPSIENPEHCYASKTTAWELSLLQRHYHPTTTKLAAHISAFCPEEGKFQLPLNLKKPAPELYNDFSMDEMAFNPSIRPPAKDKGIKKNKAGNSTPSSLDTKPTQSVEFDENIDFYAAFQNKT